MFGFELFFFILATYTVLRMAAAVVFLTPEYSLSKKKKKRKGEFYNINTQVVAVPFPHLHAPQSVRARIAGLFHVLRLRSLCNRTTKWGMSTG